MKIVRINKPATDVPQMADKTEVKDFTPRELEIMAKAWNCMVEEPKVDYTKLAAELGMGNVRSASNAWATIKKKIMAKAGIDPSEKKVNGEDGDEKPKATPKKRAKKAAAEGGDEEEGPTPKKRARTPKKKAKSEEKVEEDGDGEESGSPVKKEAEEEED